MDEKHIGQRSILMQDYWTSDFNSNKNGMQGFYYDKCKAIKLWFRVANSTFKNILQLSMKRFLSISRMIPNLSGITSVWQRVNVIALRLCGRSVAPEVASIVRT